MYHPHYKNLPNIALQMALLMIIFLFPKVEDVSVPWRVVTLWKINMETRQWRLGSDDVTIFTWVIVKNTTRLFFRGVISLQS